MTDFLSVIVVLIIGFMLGCFFFGGLWWTLKKGLISSRPALYFLTSFLLRMGISVLGFYFTLSLNLLYSAWLSLLLCLLGFMSAKFFVSKLVSKWTPVDALKTEAQKHEGSKHAA